MDEIKVEGKRSDEGAAPAHPSLLHQVGDHDNDAGVLLPHHPPEVLEGGPKRSLSRDVGAGFVVTLTEKPGQMRECSERT